MTKFDKKMKNTTKLILFSLFFVFLLGILFKVEFIGIDNVKREEKSIFPVDSGFDDESPGHFVDTIPGGIFSSWGNCLYYYMEDYNGSIREIALTLSNPEITFDRVAVNLGVIHDIDVQYERIYLATSVYDNGIMECDYFFHTYKRLCSSPSTPLKICSNYYYNGDENDFDVIWMTSDDVYHWDNLEGTIKLVANNFYPTGISMDDEEVLYYNSEHVYVYNTESKKSELVISSTGIRSACFSNYLRDIYYSRDDDYDSIADGEIIQYDRDWDISTIIKNDCDYPVDLYTNQYYLYWIDRGNMSDNSMIYRYGDYHDLPDTQYTSRVSRAHGNMWSEKIIFENNYGAYCGSDDNLYIINTTDTNPPEKIIWLTSNKTVDENYWNLNWNPAYDLNDIQYYELWESNTTDFNNYDIFWIPTMEVSILNKVAGNYYYKIRANDSIDAENSNIGEWSEMLEIKCEYDPGSSPPPDGDSSDDDPSGENAIPGYPSLFLIVMIIFTILAMLSYKIKRNKINNID